MVSRAQGLMQAVRSFDHEVDDLRSLFLTVAGSSQGSNNPVASIRRAAAWHCVIDLQDSWARFVKDVIYRSARGRVVTRQGLRLSRCSGLGWQDDVELYLKQNWPDRWGVFGPPWHVTGTPVKAAGVLGLTNRSTIVSSFGVTLPAPSELQACRNFLAHRHQRTAKHIDIVAIERRLGLPRYSVRPAELPATAVPGAGVLLFEQWCIQLKSIAYASTE